MESEIRVVMKGVRFVGAGTAWRHPFGSQAPYQWCVVFWFMKNVVFRIFAEQEPPSSSFVLPGSRLLILALGATNFSSLRSFCKTAFSDSLTVRFRWNFGRWSQHVVLHFERWRFKLDNCRGRYTLRMIGCLNSLIVWLLMDD